jgi:hypothetical protein
MKTKLIAVAILASLMMLAAAPLWAHHAFNQEFDGNKPLKLRGTVKKMEWINPHSWIHLDVKGTDGKVSTWMVEGGSPNALIRAGFTTASLPAGTEILVDAFQAKDGTNKACGVDLVFAKDGKRLFLGGSAPGATGNAPAEER